MDILANIDNNFESYQKIISFYQSNSSRAFEDIRLELRRWFAANMSAVLGLVLDKFTDNFNDIQFDLDHGIESILSKNEFLSYYGRQKSNDYYHTTIRYQKLKSSDGKFFKSYVVQELLGREELPLLSKGAKEKMVEAIYEIFVNAQIHSDTDFIYTCGQYFPAKNKIEFTIVDGGIGFRENINRRFQVNISAEKAIRWAVEERNTTKDITGGIGLPILRDFIRRNRGKMQIVSNEGFYQYSRSSESSRSFSGFFPGTIVNLQFNTNDNNNYLLKSEIDINNIF